jgi:hypothetical protein
MERTYLSESAKFMLENLPKERRKCLDAEQKNLAKTAINLLGIALAGHDHQWTSDERSAYEQAMRILK